MAEEQAKQEAEKLAEEQAKLETEKLAEKREAEERAKQAAELKRVKREAEELERANREAKEKAKREAEELERAKRAKEKARQEAEEKARQEAEEQAKREAEEKTRQEAEEKARQEAEKKAKQEAEEQAKQAEEKARQEAEELERAKREAEEKTKQEAEQKAKQEAEEQAKQEAEEKTKQEAEKKAKQAEEKARKEAEEKARKEAEKKAKQEAEKKAKQEAEELERANREAEEKARQEAEKKAKQEAEEKARKEAEAADQARKEAEEKARQIAIAVEKARQIAIAAEKARKEAEEREQAKKEAEEREQARLEYENTLNQKIKSFNKDIDDLEIKLKDFLNYKADINKEEKNKYKILSEDYENKINLLNDELQKINTQNIDFLQIYNDYNAKYQKIGSFTQQIETLQQQFMGVQTSITSENTDYKQLKIEYLEELNIKLAEFESTKDIINKTNIELEQRINELTSIISKLDKVKENIREIIDITQYLKLELLIKKEEIKILFETLLNNDILNAEKIKLDKTTQKLKLFKDSINDSNIKLPDILVSKFISDKDIIITALKNYKQLTEIINPNTRKNFLTNDDYKMVIAGFKKINENNNKFNDTKAEIEIKKKSYITTINNNIKRFENRILIIQIIKLINELPYIANLNDFIDNLKFDKKNKIPFYDYIENYNIFIEYQKQVDQAENEDGSKLRISYYNKLNYIFTEIDDYLKKTNKSIGDLKNESNERKEDLNLGHFFNILTINIYYIIQKLLVDFYLKVTDPENKHLEDMYKSVITEFKQINRENIGELDRMITINKQKIEIMKKIINQFIDRIWPSIENNDIEYDKLNNDIEYYKLKDNYKIPRNFKLFNNLNKSDCVYFNKDMKDNLNLLKNKLEIKLQDIKRDDDILQPIRIQIQSISKLSKINEEINEIIFKFDKEAEIITLYQEYFNLAKNINKITCYFKEDKDVIEEQDFNDTIKNFFNNLKLCKVFKDIKIITTAIKFTYLDLQNEKDEKIKDALNNILNIKDITDSYFKFKEIIELIKLLQKDYIDYKNIKLLLNNELSSNKELLQKVYSDYKKEDSKLENIDELSDKLLNDISAKTKKLDKNIQIINTFNKEYEESYINRMYSKYLIENIKINEMIEIKKLINSNDISITIDKIKKILDNVNSHNSSDYGSLILNEKIKNLNEQIIIIQTELDKIKVILGYDYFKEYIKNDIDKNKINDKSLLIDIIDKNIELYNRLLNEYNKLKENQIHVEKNYQEFTAYTEIIEKQLTGNIYQEDLIFDIKQITDIDYIYLIIIKLIKYLIKENSNFKNILINNIEFIFINLNIKTLIQDKIILIYDEIDNFTEFTKFIKDIDIKVKAEKNKEVGLDEMIAVKDPDKISANVSIIIKIIEYIKLNTNIYSTIRELISDTTLSKKLEDIDLINYELFDSLLSIINTIEMIIKNNKIYFLKLMIYLLYCKFFSDNYNKFLNDNITDKPQNHEIHLIYCQIRENLLENLDSHSPPPAKSPLIATAKSLSKATAKSPPAKATSIPQNNCITKNIVVIVKDWQSQLLTINDYINYKTIFLFRPIYRYERTSGATISDRNKEKTSEDEKIVSRDKTIEFDNIIFEDEKIHTYEKVYNKCYPHEMKNDKINIIKIDEKIFQNFYNEDTTSELYKICKLIQGPYIKLIHRDFYNSNTNVSQDKKEELKIQCSNNPKSSNNPKKFYNYSIEVLTLQIDFIKLLYKLFINNCNIREQSKLPSQKQIPSSTFGSGRNLVPEIKKPQKLPDVKETDNVKETKKQYLDFISDNEWISFFQNKIDYDKYKYYINYLFFLINLYCEKININMDDYFYDWPDINKIDDSDIKKKIQDIDNINKKSANVKGLTSNPDEYKLDELKKILFISDKSINSKYYKLMNLSLLNNYHKSDKLKNLSLLNLNNW